MYKYSQFLILFVWSLLWAGCKSTPEEAAEVQNSQISETIDSNGSASKKRTVMIFGDSITAGYGLPEEQAYPALLQGKIDEQGWAFEVINAGLSGDTSAGGLRRISWMLKNPVDVFILELGGNDGLRGTPPEVTKQNLKQIIRQVREKNPEVQIIVAGMQIPPNLGVSHTERFREIFGEVAEEQNTGLIPFLLENVGGIRELNQPDGIHPTADGHKIIAQTVWKTLSPVLQQMANVIK